VKEKVLQYHQAKVVEHKKYLFSVIYDFRVTLFGILLPALVLGWKLARITSFRKMLPELVKVGVATSYAEIKRRISSEI